MEIVLLTIVVLIVWSWQKRHRSIAKDRIKLDEAVWGVVARLSHGRESLLKTILQCDFVGTVDGREQRLVWMHLDEFDIWVSKETRRPRVWVELKKNGNYTQIVCRSTSKLGKAVNSLFSSIVQHSKPLSEDAKQAMQEQIKILHEIGASEDVIANAEKTAEYHGVFVPKLSE